MRKRLRTNQRAIRERSDKFVNDGALQLALCALRAELTQRKTLAMLLAFSLIIGVSGPFQPFEFMGLWHHIRYWSFMVIGTYCLGSIATDLMGTALNRLDTRLGLMATSVGLSLVVAAFIGLSNGALLDQWPSSLMDRWQHLIRITPICTAIVIGSLFCIDDLQDRAVPALLLRLPLEKRGALMALTVSDHYVNIITTKGQTMILMRLPDAIAKCAPVDGLQVHRSHWVATSHIMRVESTGDRAACHMTTGDAIPVSRSYMPALREANLLPRGRNG